jgi:hypothetical protein
VVAEQAAPARAASIASAYGPPDRQFRHCPSADQLEAVAVALDAFSDAPRHPVASSTHCRDRCS